MLAALRDARAIVVQGGTGSGKTTQLPKFLLAAGYAEKGMIGVTQPRRIAALSIADRLRQETGRPELIGAKIRFHEDVPREARVKVMTDGVLLQEFRRDPLLRRYACVILDEAHERSLNVDILLGIFKGLLPRRPDFRLVVTSATLDAARFAAFLGGEKTPAPIVEVEGRQYPVAIEYWDPGAGDEDDEAETPASSIPTVEAAAMAIRDLEKRAPDNLLAFLPTEKEIHELHRELEGDLGKRFAILPLYSRLGPADQKKVFQESHQPKIILATNIAETSLTIPGIGYVVDTGLARVSRYHPQTKIQGLPIERVSQASARQRSGRAGRVKPGVCVRLYAEEDYETRPPFGEPEILRSNLANVVLQLLALGLDVEDFPFPDPPAPSALKGSIRQLHELGAVDSPEMDARLTDEGLRLSRLPVDVALGKILLQAETLGVLPPAMVIAAGLTVADARYVPHEEPDKGKAVGLHRRFENPSSDFLGILQLWVWIHRNWESYSQRRLRRLCLDNFFSYNRVREWIDLTEQFGRLLKVTADLGALKAEQADPDALHKAILAGFLPFLARRKREDVGYRLAGEKEAFIHPGSSLAKRKPEWIVAGEVRQTSRTFIFRAAEIKPAWVEELAPEACKKSYTAVTWNPERGFVEAMERVTFKSFVIRQDRRVNYESVAPEECAEIFWREGVVLGGSGAPFTFREANLAVLDVLAGLERKARVRGLVPEEESLVHWYRERAPEVTSRISLERFLAGAGPEALRFTAADWAGPSSGRGGLQGDWEIWLPEKTKGHPLETLFPDAVRLGGLRYPVSYRFDHGDPVDGISLTLSLDALPALSVPALLRALPGWRKWIWDAFLERLPAKVRQAAMADAAGLARAWTENPGPDDAAPSPAASLAALFAARGLAAGQALSLPASWPSYLQAHLFVQGPGDRRRLVHVDPASGSADLFQSLARLEPPGPLAWKGRSFAPDPFSASRRFFHDGAEAAFHAAAAAFLAAAPPPPPSDSLPSFFTRRCEALLAAWGCPEAFLKETSALRALICSRWLPALYRDWRAAGGNEAQGSEAEKEIPPCRAAPAKPGTQVKSLTTLGQAVSRGGADSWAGAALCLSAALVSYPCFVRWYRFFAQPPMHAADSLRRVLGDLLETRTWRETLAFPFHAAWLAQALEAALPETAPPPGRSEAYRAALPDAGWREALQSREAAARLEESARKSFKAARDAFAGRLAALGAGVAGQPAEIRAALDVLDQGPIPARIQAELDLTLHVGRLEGRAGMTAKAAETVQPAAKATETPAALEARDRLMKGLSGRFKKL